MYWLGREGNSIGTILEAVQRQKRMGLLLGTNSAPKLGQFGSVRERRWRRELGG